METLDIKIALDPVNDGAVLKETKLKRKVSGKYGTQKPPSEEFSAVPPA